MSTHTPGPWFVTGQMTKYIEARISGGLIQEVAACGPTEADGGYGDQQRANAALIAAAPDLLEALVSLQTAAYNIGGEHITDYAQLIIAADKADDIIAKARGKS